MKQSYQVPSMPSVSAWLSAQEPGPQGRAFLRLHQNRWTQGP